MDQMSALRHTMRLYEAQSLTSAPTDESLTREYLRSMAQHIMEADLDGKTFSPSKLGRWLGWIQCAVVATTDLTLEDMKEVNVHHIED